MHRLKTINRKTIIRLLKAVTHIGALIPLLVLYWDYQGGGLGVDPVREITLRTGKTTLIMLVLTIAVTPVNIILGWKSVLPLRRLLGLYTFLYVSVHFLSFIWLDYLFDWLLIIDGIADQKYVLVGFLAGLLMVPLAASSNRWGMRKLGKKWKPLHRTIYVVAVLAIIHFIWLVKNVYTEPIIYGTIVTLLLLTRVKFIKQKVLRWRRRPSTKGVTRTVSAD